MAHPLLLIDANSLFYRAFHASPPLTAANGIPVGAVQGTLLMILALIHDYQPVGVGVVFDAKGKNFRHRIYPEYKATRNSMPEELRAQIPALYELIEDMGLALLVEPDVEADDVIATLATQASAAGQEVVIASGDKDLCQLVNDRVRMINTMKNEVFTPSKVQDKFGVPPELIPDYLTLVGDKSDNIPGVFGIGEKTAAKLLRAHGTLNGIIAAMEGQNSKTAQNIRAALPTIPMIQSLVITKRDCALPLTWQELAPKPANQAKLHQTLTQLNLKRVIKQLIQEGFLDAQADPEHLSLELDLTLSDAPAPKLIVHSHRIEDMTSWQHWLAVARSEGRLCFDLETTSLNLFDARIVGIAVHSHRLGSAYAPLAHRLDINETQLPFDAALAAITPLLSDSNLPKLGHNLKYDRHVLRNHGIELAGICDDSMLQSYVLNPSATRHNMDQLARHYLGHNAISFEDVAGKGKQQKRFDDISLAVATPYACEDVAITQALYDQFSQALDAQPSLMAIYRDIERPLMPVLGDMERAGVKIDTAALLEQSQGMAEDIKLCEQRAYQLAGTAFNLASSSQLAHILFEQMGLPALKKTPGGKPSTNEEVLEQLANTYELPAVILEYRQLSKLKSTYLDALPTHIHPKTGRVHTQFHQAVTATGRLSSSDPNVQNIPIKSPAGKRIRKAFIAADQHLLIAADYSQIELRIMAHLSQDASLIRAFHDGLDIHRATASEVFSTPLPEVTDEQRRAAKAVNFGLIYGMSAFGLAKQLGVERKLAQSYIDSYFARYTGVADYMNQTKTAARTEGFVETLLGRRLYLPDIQSKNAALRNYAERTAINAPLQGSAADFIKLAMIAMQDWLSRQHSGARMILQVHDELILECPEQEVEQVQQALKQAMESVYPLNVPLVADVGIGRNWDEAKA